MTKFLHADSIQLLVVLCILACPHSIQAQRPDAGLGPADESIESVQAPRSSDFGRHSYDRPQRIASNAPPKAIGSIPGQAVLAGATLQLDISEYFHDPDNDSLTYVTTTAAPAVAMGTMSGSILTIAGVAPGAVILKVAALDPDRQSAEHNIEVTVDRPRPWWPWTDNFGIDPRLLAVGSHHFIQIGKANPGEVRIFGNDKTLDLQLFGVDIVGYVNKGQGRIGANFGLGFTNQIVEVVPDSADSTVKGGADTQGTSRTTAVVFLSGSVFLQFGDHLRLNAGLITGIASNLGLDAYKQDDTAVVIGISLSTMLEETIKDSLAKRGS